ncbi:metallophosphatase [Mucilaginibacter sp. PPCGB 2223]|uniref:metallophosphoesterase n=1 Tax=Mucilaginibacter sp. PPCGB 2223 TaxID=1886027 RepID=UPI0008259C5D|nr:metallophosphoesterase [Mucilaginibacter sp. PPCGB 2223]OCX51037.1 metallophosphatase [Mucilaginibacter sp. PPCGB 2223]
MQQFITILTIAAILLVADAYIITGVRTGLKKWKFTAKRAFTWWYWGISIFLILGLFASIYIKFGIGFKGAILLIFFVMLGAKILFLPFLVVDDVRRLLLWKARKHNRPEPEFPASQPAPDTIPRSEFLMKAGLLAGALPMASLGYGIINGAYEYRVKHRTLYLPNLPKAFDGIKLGQLSDIHSGSFYNKKAVTGGVEMLLKEKPDFIFFTGDLVNNISSEMRDYQDIFAKVKAPLGVYSSLGNHDYGDYHSWPTLAAKQKNLDDLKATHKNMGWDLILNDNRRLKVDGEEIGILGVENWGSMSRFPKYGRIDLAERNTQDLPVKLLLSHDPSHWRAQVLDHKDIDVMFAGHTHGMQFGIQTKHFQWSPIQYVYKEWAGLYREGNQQLYVNTGFGFLGYPGRVGILPEITIFTLKAAADPALKGKTA